MPAVWKIVLFITLLLISNKLNGLFSAAHCPGCELSNDYNERRPRVYGQYSCLGLFSANVMGMFLFFKPSQYPRAR